MLWRTWLHGLSSSLFFSCDLVSSKGNRCLVLGVAAGWRGVPGELNPVAGVGVGTGGQKDVFQNLVLRGVVEIRIQNVKKSVESSRGRV